MQQRRKFSREYKLDAVQLVQQSAIPLHQLTTNLGINDNMLRCWTKEYSEPNKATLTGYGSSRDHELATLRQELKQIMKECDFLRETATVTVKSLVGR